MELLCFPSIESPLFQWLELLSIWFVLFCFLSFLCHFMTNYFCNPCLLCTSDYFIWDMRNYFVVWQLLHQYSGFLWLICIITVSLVKKCFRTWPQNVFCCSFRIKVTKYVVIKLKYVMPEVNWLLALFVVLGTFEK
jgi:hypothetical protein